MFGLFKFKVPKNFKGTPEEVRKMEESLHKEFSKGFKNFHSTIGQINKSVDYLLPGIDALLEAKDEITVPKLAEYQKIYSDFQKYSNQALKQMEQLKERKT